MPTIREDMWGFSKVWYRGFAKHAVRAFAAFALADLCLVRYRLGTVRYVFPESGDEPSFLPGRSSPLERFA
jgi:hypothetical protein